MKKLRLVADARREFFQQIAYYEQQRTGLGKRFRRAAEAAFLRAGSTPLHGKPGAIGTHRLLIEGFPLAIVYVDSDSEVMVYAVTHLSRRPDYWTERLPGGAVRK